jgi:hypothetical protein
MKLTKNQLLEIRAALRTFDTLSQRTGGIVEGLVGKTSATVSINKWRVIKALEEYDKEVQALFEVHGLEGGMELKDVPQAYWDAIEDLGREEVEVELKVFGEGCFDEVKGLPPSFFDLISPLL